MKKISGVTNETIKSIVYILAGTLFSTFFVWISLFFLNKLLNAPSDGILYLILFTIFAAFYIGSLLLVFMGIRYLYKRIVFRKPVLHIENDTGVLGGKFRGSLIIRSKQLPEQDMKLVLSCNYLQQALGEAYERRILWGSRQTVSIQKMRIDGDRVIIPIDFDIPYDLPQSGKYYPVQWWLECDCVFKPSLIFQDFFSKIPMVITPESNENFKYQTYEIPNDERDEFLISRGFQFINDGGNGLVIPGFRKKRLVFKKNVLELTVKRLLGTKVYTIPVSDIQYFRKIAYQAKNSQRQHVYPLVIEKSNEKRIPLLHSADLYLVDCLISKLIELGGFSASWKERNKLISGTKLRSEEWAALTRLGMIKRDEILLTSLLQSYFPPFLKEKPAFARSLFKWNPGEIITFVIYVAAQLSFFLK